MEITKELLEKRIQELTTQKEQLIANVNACEGGILILRGLISDLKCNENEGAGENPVPSGAGRLGIVKSKAAAKFAPSPPTLNFQSVASHPLSQNSLRIVSTNSPC